MNQSNFLPFCFAKVDKYDIIFIMEKNHIILNNENIKYYLIRKNVKNMSIRIDKDSNVIITVPKKLEIDEIEKFILKKANWIIKSINKIKNLPNIKEELVENGKIYFYGKKYNVKIINDKKRNIELEKDDIIFYVNLKTDINKLYEEWIRKSAKQELLHITQRFCEIIGKKKFPEVEIRKMKARWGTCFSNKNKIILNMSLIKTDYRCMEYVVLHELAHFIHQNHSKDFYRYISNYLPDWKERKRILNEKYLKIL